MEPSVTVPARTGETTVERLVRTVYDRDPAPLDEAVLDQVKRVLVDAVACTVGGVGSPPARAAAATAEALGGRPRATVVGSAARTSPVLATLVNGTQLRYLDYMDTLLFEGSTGAVSATHPSELVPALLATAEAAGCPGARLAEAVAVAYELAAGLCATLAERPLRDLGWHHASLAPYILPAVAGWLGGAAPAQAVAATGLAASHNVALNHVDADGEEGGPGRNLVYPLVAANCLLDLDLARAGLGDGSGRERIAEGAAGFEEVVGRRVWSLADLPFDPAYGGILRVWMKPAVACVLGQGAATAAMALATEARVRERAVEAVTVAVKPPAFAHMGGEGKRFPTEKEVADHSLYFLTAVALRDGAVGPDHFREAVYADPLVRELAGRVELLELEADAPGSPSAAEVTVQMSDGARYARRVEDPPGHPDRAFSAADVERKLRGCAEGRLEVDRVERFLDAVDRIERLDDAGDLVRVLAA